MIDRREDLIDGDLTVMVGIAREARCHFGILERDVYHGEDIIDGHRPVAVAVADTGDGERRC